MSKQKAIVLLSAGLDSSVNFYKSIEEYEIILALTFNYGQKAFKKESECASAICKGSSIAHKVIKLPWLKEISTNSALTNDSKNIPTSDVNIKSMEASQSTAKAVWVKPRHFPITAVNL